jgi:CheY-like chemotaxis protein
MNQLNILWVDDEIHLLKPHILFLEEKGYLVSMCSSGYEAVKRIKNEHFNIVLLDENMPGMDGLETLGQLKELQPTLKVIMITNNQEERIMNDALGSKISDYLLKPVHPNQILLSLKKNLELPKIISEKATMDYQKEFGVLSSEIERAQTYQNWVDIYKKLMFWEETLEEDQSGNLSEILESQKFTANQYFAEFIEQNYPSWIQAKEAPVLSHQLYREKIRPELQKKTLLVVIDNLRYDQWRKIAPIIDLYYQIDREEVICSILPTATQYARNALFSGLTPLEMERQHPDLWKNEIDQGGKNNEEAAFFKAQLKRLGDSIKWSYDKISNQKQGQKFLSKMHQLKDNDLSILVYNTIDILSHAKTEMNVIKELAADDKAYRSLTKSWFENSPLLDIVKKASEMNLQLLLTTDHGTIRVKNPSIIKANKEVNSNFRYKLGSNLKSSDKEMVNVPDPTDYGLPVPSISSTYVFATSDRFFAYPNNYNQYINHYKDSYQHGGISLEEMILPFVVLVPK